MDLEKRVDELVDYFKVTLRLHIEPSKVGSEEGFHCARHALTPQSAKYAEGRPGSKCDHAHTWACEECGAVDVLISRLTDLAQRCRAPETDADCSDIVATLDLVRTRLLNYKSHVIRDVWQRARIQEIVRDLGADTCYIIQDFKNKQLQAR